MLSTKVETGPLPLCGLVGVRGRDRFPHFTTTPTRFSKVLDVALLLATDKALLAGVLDLVLPRLLDQMQADRRMAMVQGCDRSLARVLGWLVTSLRCFVKNPDVWSPHGHIGDISTGYSC